jgi:2',3'-cyclic-nucleotide 2'-phosphodiesterase (5'-nucleotidase family)
MNRRLVLVAALIVATAGPGFSRAAFAQQDDPGAPRRTAPLTLLQINDVYSIAPVANGMGGLARVATLKQQLTESGRTPFMVLAGDFLSSSVESTVFKGEQMIAALNAAGLDLATLGNHEFDFGKDILVQRMAEAKWQWVVSNVVDAETGKPIGGASPYVVRTFGSLKVGFIGLCLLSEGIRSETLKQIRIIPPVEAAATYLPALRREGVHVVVAVTHLTFAEDRELAERFPEIDLIIGGHEHFPITATEKGTLISKAGSDAKYVARIDVNRRPNGTVERFYELLPITAAIADEPRTAAIVTDYESRLGRELETVAGATRAPLDAVTVRLRASETNVGNLIADAMRADVAADIAIVNSGGIRGDRVHDPGPLTRRQILEMQPFGNVNCKLSVSGQTVLAALESGFSKLPAAAGQFPQVSGLSLKVDARAPPGRRVSDVRVNGAPLDVKKLYTLAVSDFMLEGGDDYSMFADQHVVVGPETGTLIAVALEKYIAAKGEVNPAVEGRITIVK